MGDSGRGRRVVVVNPRRSRKSTGKGPSNASAGRPEDPSTSALTIDAFLAAKRRGDPQTGRGESEATFNQVEIRLRRLESMVGRPLHTLTEAEVVQTIDELERNDYRGPTIRDFVNAAAQMVDWGIFNHLTSDPVNPWRTKKRKPHAMPRRSEKVELSDRQIRQLFDKIGERGPRYNIFFRIMYSSGLSLRNVLNLRWEDVTPRGLKVRDADDQVVRQIGLPKTLLAAINDYRADVPESTYLFEGPTGKPVAPQNPGDFLRRAVEELNWGVVIKPNDLRDAAAQRLQDKYGDLAMTQAFLGHTEPSSTIRRVRSRQAPVIPYEEEIFETPGEA